jgi:hypothetical protein
MDTAQESDLAHFLGDLSHIEKEYKIKPPLRLELILGCTFIAQFFKNANMQMQLYHFFEPIVQQHAGIHNQTLPSSS